MAKYTPINSELSAGFKKKKPLETQNVQNVDVIQTNTYINTW